MTLLHEMGHCLGLEDDPPSLDLSSIMSSKLLYVGGLTQADRDELRSQYKMKGLM
jgi:hypothetical protein